MKEARCQDERASKVFSRKGESPPWRSPSSFHHVFRQPFGPSLYLSTSLLFPLSIPSPSLLSRSLCALPIAYPLGSPLFLYRFPFRPSSLPLPPPPPPFHFLRFDFASSIPPLLLVSSRSFVTRSRILLPSLVHLLILPRPTGSDSPCTT